MTPLYIVGFFTANLSIVLICWGTPLCIIVTYLEQMWGNVEKAIKQDKKKCFVFAKINGKDM